MKQSRKKTSLDIRLSPCEICGFPLVHVHHTLPFAKWNETNVTMHLCPNCHELLHIAINALVYKKKRATSVWNAFCDKIDRKSPLVKSIENRVYEWTETNYEFTLKHYDIED